jgi:hypothetical protein
LIEIHDITHHLGMECNRVPHTLLKFKVGVMEEVFIGFAYDGLVCHMMQALCD